jgi:hypothetical protein
LRFQQAIHETSGLSVAVHEGVEISFTEKVFLPT